MSMKIQEFLSKNGLKQRDLVQFLGISSSAMSQVVSGRINLSEDNLSKLLSNEEGWDTSMLCDSEGDTFEINTTGPTEIYNKGMKIAHPEAQEVKMLKLQVAMLEEQLATEKARTAEEKERANRYWAMIEKLTTK